MNFELYREIRSYKEIRSYRGKLQLTNRLLHETPNLELYRKIRSFNMYSLETVYGTTLRKVIEARRNRKYRMAKKLIGIFARLEMWARLGDPIERYEKNLVTFYLIFDKLE